MSEEKADSMRSFMKQQPIVEEDEKVKEYVPPYVVYKGALDDGEDEPVDNVKVLFDKTPPTEEVKAAEFFNELHDVRVEQKSVLQRVKEWFKK